MVILLLVVVALTTFAPCCLYDNCAQEQEAGSCAEGEGEKGACSPFSSCAACVGCTTPRPLMQVAAVAPLAPQHRSREAVSSLPTVAYAFWQPPKVAAPAC